MNWLLKGCFVGKLSELSKLVYLSLSTLVASLSTLTRCFCLNGKFSSMPLGTVRPVNTRVSLSLSICSSWCLYWESAFYGIGRSRSLRSSACDFSIRFLPYAIIGLKNLGISMEYRVLQNTMSLIRILSSKVALNDPGWAFSLTTRFIEPRMPETVLIEAP